MIRIFEIRDPIYLFTLSLSRSYDKDYVIWEK